MDFCKILKESPTIAVVGISDKPGRDSGQIAALLSDRGFKVYGVHPKLKEVFNITVYPNLSAIPEKPDLVDIFLSGEKLPEILSDILNVKPKYVWFQLGVFNDIVKSKLENAGITVIENRCIAVELRNCANLNN